MTGEMNRNDGQLCAFSDQDAHTTSERIMLLRIAQSYMLLADYVSEHDQGGVNLP